MISSLIGFIIGTSVALILLAIFEHRRNKKFVKETKEMIDKIHDDMMNL